MYMNIFPPGAEISRKVRMRLIIFLGITVVLLGLIVWDIFQGYVSWWLAPLVIAAGLALGYALGRSMKVRLDDEEKIVTHMDIIGFIAIGIYIAVAILRNVLLDHWLTGSALTAVTLCVVAGALFGRYLGIYRSIERFIASRDLSATK